MKQCTDCKQLKELSEFHKKGNTYQYRCKVCQNKYTREHYETNKTYYKNKAKKYKAELIQFYEQIKSVPCTDCGHIYPPYVMQFDHLPEYSKKCTVSSLVNKGNKSLMLEEMDKCEIVCANCHAIRTHNRKTSTSTPGSS